MSFKHNLTLYEHNLLLILESSNESLKFNDFKNLDGSPLSFTSELIFHLTEMDLIEFDEDAYYLTPEAYDIIEGGEVNNYIFDYFYFLNRKDEESIQVEEKNNVENTYQADKPEKKRLKWKNTPEFESFIKVVFVIGFIKLLLVLTGGFKKEETFRSKIQNLKPENIDSSGWIYLDSMRIRIIE